MAVRWKGAARGVIAALAALSLVGCAQTTRTSPEARSSRSLQAEQAQAQRVDGEIQRQLQISDDRRLTAYVESVAARIHAVRPAGAPKPVVRVIEDDTPNAFTTGGGYVYFHTGLLKILENEAQFAMVMGHELAHGDLDHIARGQQNRAAAGVAGALAQVLIGSTLGGGVGGQAAGVLAGLGIQAGYTSYSRNYEREADQVGIRYLAAAGYDTREGAQAYRRLAEASGGRAPIPWLSTHPMSDERLRDMEAVAARMPGGQYTGAKTYRRRVLGRL